MRDFPEQGSRGGLDTDQVRKRLELYSRYAGLIDAQVRALDAEDLDHFAELAGARDKIQEALREEPTGLPSQESLDRESRALLESVRRDLRAAMVRDRELRERVKTLRDDTRTRLDAMSQRKEKVRQYVTEEDVANRREARRVNVRL